MLCKLCRKATCITLCFDSPQCHLSTKMHNSVDMQNVISCANFPCSDGGPMVGHDHVWPRMHVFFQRILAKKNSSQFLELQQDWKCCARSSNHLNQQVLRYAPSIDFNLGCVSKHRPQHGRCLWMHSQLNYLVCLASMRSTDQLGRENRPQG